MLAPPEYKYETVASFLKFVGTRRYTFFIRNHWRASLTHDHTAISLPVAEDIGVDDGTDDGQLVIVVVTTTVLVVFPSGHSGHVMTVSVTLVVVIVYVGTEAKVVIGTL
jgi:hypothetical protein